MPMKRNGLMLLLVTLQLICCGAVHAESLQQNLVLCGTCHGPQGAGNQALAAPALAGQDRAYLDHQLHSFRDGKRGYHPDDQAGTRMRAVALKLSDAEISQLATQFGSMKQSKKSAEVKVGRESYNTTCLFCHGQYAQGYAQLQSPNLNILEPWYITAQIAAYNKGWRATATEQDLPALMMRTIASHLGSQKELDEVNAYIGSLSVPVRP